MKPYILLAALALIGCEKSANSQSDADGFVIDQGLRGLYAVGSIAGSCDVPKGMKHYIIASLEFKDGEFVRRGSLVENSVENLQSKKIAAQFLWNSIEGEDRTALIFSGGSTRGESDIWKRITGSRGFRDGSVPEYEGFKVLGFGVSAETRAGTVSESFGPGLRRGLEERMYVGVLAVRFFSSKEQLDQFDYWNLTFPKVEATPSTETN